MTEAFRAQAAHCDLSVVLQLVSAQWLTGQLWIESAVTIEGRIACAEGLPMDATCGSLEGLPAFYEVFLVPQTQMRFFVQDVPRRDEGLGEGMVLLLEACRRLDEWRTLSPLRLARTAAVPDFDPPLSPLWDALDGQQTLGHLVAQLGLSRAAVVDPVRTWVQEQHVLPSPEAPPVAVAPREGARPDTIAMLARGRAQVRAGAIREAIASFESALALDPHHLLAQQHLLRLRQLHPDLFDRETT